MSLKSGYLKKYFKAIIAKELRDVEVNPGKSNQHEFNGISALKAVFGLDDRKFPADFLYIDDEESVSSKDFLTWYDARRNHPTRTEYRLYYPSSEVTYKASSGDILFICLKSDDTVLCIIAQKDATITSQLCWLFNISDVSTSFTLDTKLETDSGELEFAVRTILGQIGVEYEEQSDDELMALLIEKFNGSFPKTNDFSAFARSLVKDFDPVGMPDSTLISWFDMEEKIFFLMEQHTIRERLRLGFIKDDEVDVDGFVKFSLSVQNRRKARAGLSLENHISALLDANGIVYSHTPVTENKSKPDFIFPDIKCYKNEDFPKKNLTMLGSKSTCKDRWRQVLAEANRIDRKHLLTLEAAISKFQTDEMKDWHLQLVVPESIHKTYTYDQQQWLFTVKDFLDEVKEKQRHTEFAHFLRY